MQKNIACLKQFTAAFKLSRFCRNNDDWRETQHELLDAVTEALEAVAENSDKASIQTMIRFDRSGIETLLSLKTLFTLAAMDGSDSLRAYLLVQPDNGHDRMSAAQRENVHMNEVVRPICEFADIIKHIYVLFEHEAFESLPTEEELDALEGFWEHISEGHYSVVITENCPERN